MSKPTTRILAVLELLQANGRMSGSELAERLAIERRTVRRYIVALEALGVPIMTERGRFGGYSLIPGYKLPPMVFDENEALALILGLKVARKDGLVGQVPAIASAQAKLERVMPIGLREKVKTLSEAISMYRPATDDGEQDVAHLLYVFSEAVSAQKQIQIQYSAFDGQNSDRTIAPYGLAYYLGRWYVIGHCYLRRDLRTFRLNRIVNCTVTGNSFDKPEAFDCLAYLRSAIGDIPRQFAVEVLLYTDLLTAQRYIGRELGVLVQKDNGVVLYNQSEDLGWLAGQLASWPMDFKVLKPKALSVCLKQLGERLKDK